jgi:hypothetical protein
MIVCLPLKAFFSATVVTNYDAKAAEWFQQRYRASSINRADGPANAHISRYHGFLVHQIGLLRYCPASPYSVKRKRDLVLMRKKRRKQTRRSDSDLYRNPLNGNRRGQR